MTNEELERYRMSMAHTYHLELLKAERFMATEEQSQTIAEVAVKHADLLLEALGIPEKV